MVRWLLVLTASLGSKCEPEVVRFDPPVLMADVSAGDIRIPSGRGALVLRYFDAGRECWEDAVVVGTVRGVGGDEQVGIVWDPEREQVATTPISSHLPALFLLGFEPLSCDLPAPVSCDPPTADMEVGEAAMRCRDLE